MEGILSVSKNYCVGGGESRQLAIATMCVWRGDQLAIATVGKMAQQVEMLITKPDNFNLIPASCSLPW